VKTLENKHDKDSLIARIERLLPESQAVWGKMNANQMMCHLTDQMRHAANERDNPASGNLFFRTLGKWLVLYVLPIPKNVKTSPKADQMKEGTKPTDFESDRETLLAYVEKMSALPDDFSWAAHFRFGAMNKKQWCVLTYKHADHHLRQFGV
jgi:hypothetical protein